MVYFYSQLENIWDEDAKHHDRVSHQLPPMSLYVNLSVPVKVLHMHFSLPCSLLSLSSFLFIFYVISRHFIYIYMCALHADNERKTLKTFLFYTQNCLFTTLSSYRLGTTNLIGSHSGLKVHNGRYWQAILHEVLKSKKCLRTHFLLFGE